MSERDQPWMMRTYAGHSSAEASNALYREGLARGQTGLSVAFDLPTQQGLGSDNPNSLGEVGLAGVPIDSLGDMRTLYEDIPLSKVNTSMTINATAPWLLALHIATAEEQGVDKQALRGTTQNDLMKEFLARNTQAFPLEPSLQLQNDVIEFAVAEMPKWNPINICGYHLQEAGANRVQETAFMFYNALSVLDEFRPGSERATRSGIAIADLIGRISFFLDFSTEIFGETGKVMAMTELWDEFTSERYDVTDPDKRRFRYGVQVNSANLTPQQPENNAARIILSALPAVLSRNARARAIQLPAWNEALGLPGSWDQQWSLRMQQILAYETDILEYPDIFEGSVVIEGIMHQVITDAEKERDKVEEIRSRQGPEAALAYMKGAIDESSYEVYQQGQSADRLIVGVNCFEETEDSLLPQDGAVTKVDPRAQQEQIARTEAFKEKRDNAEVARALEVLEATARSGENIMPASIRAAHAGVTTSEWGDTLAGVFGRN